MINVIKYSAENRDDWENMISESKNGTFLHSRNFMEYHKDRYADASALIYDEGNCVGIFPANYESEETVVSHSGLTYGGLVVKADTYSKNTLKYFSALLKNYRHKGVKTLRLRLLPDFYATVSQQEIEYGLNLLEAKPYKMDLYSTLDMSSYKEDISLQKRRERGKKKALENDVKVKETSDFGPFWNEILIPNLRNKHDVKPVHTLDEIRYLYDNNKGCIRQFNVYKDNDIVGGTTIFETVTTAHTQYIASNNKGRNIGALDYLFIHLIEDVFREKQYFDFGRVNEDPMHQLNVGLLDWKEGFGARGYVQKFYTVKTANYVLIDQLWEN